jgi:transposase
MTAMSDALSPTVTDPLSADTNRLETVQAENQQLREQVAKLEHQLKQLQRMIFGTRSERHVPDTPHQLSLGEAFTADEAQQPEPEKQTITYQRGKAKKVRPEDCVSDSGLRFDASVPVKTIELPASEIEGLGPDDYEVVDVKVTHRLATRPASYVVLRYERPVIKLRERQALVTTAAPVGVIERSLADVSFLTGLLIDKFQYHMPLYRQHQRLEAAGITLSRATLTHLVHRTCQLLKPIVDAQLDHILLSRVLAMDETPIKAGKSKKRRGKMQQGYYWPLYGEDDGIVFTYAGSRARYVIEDLLNEAFTGVLLSDGYKAYASYVAKTEGLIHAQFRVEGDVTAPNPRRPGRARLTHPVPHMVDSLPAMY